MRRKNRESDRPYKAFIASLPCVVCGAWPVEVAHIGLRGLMQKCSDRETIPLCLKHHAHGQPESHHTLGRYFWAHHGIDRPELLARLQAAYVEMAA